ncbi:Protein of unknown function [Pyronema omphalodes CBS 100304]|uniref:Uncharacterized protein n=1 Tax=Pyronema omphalodes (strain CBS 100304) TaxID=1076935 RepID=U4LL32_PYROM|nr:Protein of unknown function [Pyronema omphalodes CBS 100304]
MLFPITLAGTVQGRSFYCPHSTCVQHAGSISSIS